MKKKVIIASIAIVIVIVVVIGIINVKKEKQRLYENQDKNQTQSIISNDECDRMEQDITIYLKKQDFFYDDYTSIKVSSGYEKNGVITQKTKIYIILDGKFADSEEMAKALYDGYEAVLMLYFGDNDYQNYDIVLRIAGKYTVTNGVIANE